MAEILSAASLSCWSATETSEASSGSIATRRSSYQNPVISIDGVTRSDFDFIDIGAFRSPGPFRW